MAIAIGDAIPTKSELREIENRGTSPNPGSDAAVEQGCTCARLDNHRGRGRGGDGERFGWWVSGDCPLHGEEKR